ncbi:hypothetical protein Trydic_g2118 [Trypoxylus dichotomus]
MGVQNKKFRQFCPKKLDEKIVNVIERIPPVYKESLINPPPDFIKTEKQSVEAFRTSFNILMYGQVLIRSSQTYSLLTPEEDMHSQTIKLPPLCFTMDIMQSGCTPYKFCTRLSEKLYQKSIHSTNISK